VELKDDARFIGVRVGVIAGLAPLILVGYGFLCVALALWLRRFFEPPAAFALVGAVNLVGGALGIVVAARQLGHRKVLAETQTQIELTQAVVVARGEQKA